MKMTKKRIWVDFENELIISSQDQLIEAIAKEHELTVKSNFVLGDFLKKHKKYGSTVTMFNDMLKNDTTIDDLYREFDQYAYKIAEKYIHERYKEIEIEI
ncbi:MAG: hypothetical protein IKY94_15405 [Lachnospiraceae bacterium]|nr:hypothetical protein [Lachnospiraceae bacterium]